jgi:hypothetical protein
MQRCAVDRYAFGAAQAGALARRARHRCDQAHRRRLAVGAGDERFGNVVQRRPRHIHRQRQGGTRVRAARVTSAKRYCVVVHERGYAALRSGFQQTLQRTRALGGGTRGEVVGRPYAQRMQSFEVDAAALLARPLVDLGGGEQSRFRRSEYEQEPLRTAMRHRLRIGPAE